MKFRYKFVTGEETVVEVDDAIGMEIMDMRRDEHANNEKQRYHYAGSIDAEGCSVPVNDDTPEQALLQKEFEEKRKAMLETLTPVQRRRFELYEDGFSVAEIARMEGGSYSSVRDSIDAARNRLKKIYKTFFEKHPQF